MKVGMKLLATSDSKLANESMYMYTVGGKLDLSHNHQARFSFAISYISRFMTAPKTNHWIADKRILRYVKGIKEYGILYGSGDDFQLTNYTNSNCLGLVDDRKSTTVYFQPWYRCSFMAK